MCEMTSIGEMSAARITTPQPVVLAAPCGDLRRALTTSLTPRLRVLFFAAVKEVSSCLIEFSYYQSPIGRPRSEIDANYLS